MCLYACYYVQVAVKKVVFASHPPQFTSSSVRHPFAGHPSAADRKWGGGAEGCRRLLILGIKVAGSCFTLI